MVKINGFEVTGKWVGVVSGFPNDPTDKYSHHQFRITVKNLQTGGRISFNFYGSYADFERGIKALDGGALRNAFMSFVDDAIAGEMSIEDFADEFGYDITEARTRKIHRACEVQLEKAEKIGIVGDELYNLSNKLRRMEEEGTVLAEPQKPKIIIYDNTGKTFDRYAVIIGDDVYGMSHNPLSPQGFNQYAGTVSGGDVVVGSHLGKRVHFERLPKDVRTAIKDRIRG